MRNGEVKAAEGDATFGTGAVRSADADGLDFLSLPLIGLIGAARTAAEGAAKYGRFNYLRGMPAHTCLNHAMRHIVMYGAGDRSEPHLSHAIWNLMAAEQSAVLHPEINGAHLPGPGYTVSPEMAYRMDEEDPVLARRRRDPEFRRRVADWDIREVPEVETITDQRDLENDLLGVLDDEDDD